jgi:hypothetical protein
MRWILWGVAAAGLVLGGSMGASAQGMGGMSGGMGMMGYTSQPRAYRAAKPAPRARAKRYGYRSSAAGSCGLYKYWSKGACKDARTSPPNLK